MSQKTCPDVDRRSLVGWGTGEDEEAGAILRVFSGLGDFLFWRLDGSTDDNRWAVLALLLTWSVWLHGVQRWLALDGRRECDMKRRQQGILTGMPFMANITPRTFVDDLGQENLSGQGTPTRIVSLAPSITEILFAIGLDDGDCRRHRVLRLSAGGPAETEDGLCASESRIHGQSATGSGLGAHATFCGPTCMAKLEQLKIPTFVVDPESFEDIPLRIQTSVASLTDPPPPMRSPWHAATHRFIRSKMQVVAARFVCSTC